MRTLLAIDLGLKAGLACYGDDGRLVWFKSVNFATVTRLKKAIPVVLAEAGDVEVLFVEGDRHHGELWAKLALKRGARVVRVAPERWREHLLLPRDRRTGVAAKETADSLARRVIAWSDARRPTSLKHDAAEAILIGLYGVLAEGWLAHVPDELRM